MKNLILTLTVCIFLLTSRNGYSQTTPAECAFIGGLPAKFEPKQGNSYFIIGQNNSAIQGYMANVGNNPMPSGFTLYTNPRNEGLFNSFYNNNCETNNILALANDPVYDNSAIVIGYFWAAATYGEHIGDVMGGNPNQAFINDLDAFADWCKAQNRPIFLRLGFEFDLQYQGYHDFYVATWQYIVNRFRSRNVENVAFVWQASYGNGNWANDYQRFYPGDSYVDWFGYSQWETSIYGNTMVAEARNHGKPLIICEAAPKTQTGNWSWYSDVINYIKANDDVIKGFAYINFDWVGGGSGGCWNPAHGWGDSEIQDWPTIESNWLAEMAGDFWIKGGYSQFIQDAQTNWSCAAPPVKCSFSVENEIDRIYQDESLILTDESFGLNTITSWNWDFGPGGGTSVSQDPGSIQWTSPGLKTIQLTVAGGGESDVCTTDILVEATPNGCAYNDEFDAPATSEQFIDMGFGCCAGPGVNNAFGHDVSNSAWTVSVDGHGSFDFFTYHFNDGSSPFSLNLSHILAQPKVTIRARKVPNTANPVSGATTAAMLKIDMFDYLDVPTDGLPASGFNNRIELTEQFQDYTIDFTGFLENYYSVNGYSGFGPLDERKLLGLRFMINPFWNESYAESGFEAPYSGDIEIEHIYIGDGCDGSIVPCISANKGSASPGETITFTDCSAGTISSYNWDFGTGTTPSSSTTQGPHSVSYTTVGMKTITLTVNGTEVATENILITDCNAAYFDHFASENVTQFTGGAGASAAFTYGYDAVEDALTISSGGHGEWQYAAVRLNDGVVAEPVDISETSAKLYIRAKATTNMALRVSPVGENGALAQTSALGDFYPGYETGKFDLPITTSWQVFEIDFTGNMWDEWSGTGSIHDGAGNNSPVEFIRLMPNQGWASCSGCASLGSSQSFVGTLYIDYILFDGDTSSCLSTSPPVCNGITIADAGTPQTSCEGSIITLDANPAGAGETGTWSGASVDFPNDPTSTVTGLSPGTHTLIWTISDNDGLCTSTSDQVTLTIETKPVSSAGADQSVGVDNTTLTATGSGTWSLIAGSGNITSPTNTQSSVTNLSEGINTFRWTVASENSCSDATDDVTISYTIGCNGITAANAGPDDNVCQNETLTLAGNNVSMGETGTWTTSGDGSLSNPNSPSSQYTFGNDDISSGSVTLTWTIDNGGSCTVTSDEVIYTISSLPDQANAGTNQTLCGSSATLSANTPTIGTGSWSRISGSGTISNSSSATTNVSDLDNGSNTFRWTINGNECPDQTDEVTITIECSGPQVDFSADNTSICEGSSVIFTSSIVNPSGNETFTWNFGTRANPSTATGAGPHTINYNSSGSYTVTMIATDMESTTITKNNYIVVNTTPEQLSISGNTEVVCNSSSETYSVTNISGAIYNWNATLGSFTGQGTANINFDFTGQSGSGSISVTPMIGSCVGTSSSIQVSLCVSDLEIENNMELKYFPNPTNGVVNIEFSREADNSLLHIHDINGNSLTQTKLNGITAKFDLSDYPTGIYLVQIITKTGSYSFKVVKE